MENNDKITSKLFNRYAKGISRPTNSIIRRKRDRLLSLEFPDMFEEIIKDVTTELDMANLCHKILINVQMLTNADRCSLFLVNDKELEPLLFDIKKSSSTDDSMQKLKNLSIPIGTGIAGYVAKNNVAVNIKDAYKDERFSDTIDKQTGYKTKSLLCLPITNSDNEVIAVAEIINKLDGTEFNDDDQSNFRRYLMFCGLGMMNAKLFQMSLQEFRRNEIVLEMARNIMKEQTSLEEFLKSVMKESIKIFSCDFCYIYLTPKMEISSYCDFEFLNIYKFAEDSDFAKIIENDETLKSLARRSILLNETTGNESKSVISTVIYDKSKLIIGCVQLIKQSAVFSSWEESILEAFIIFCGAGIENTKQMEEMRKFMLKQKVTLEMFTYHTSPSTEEINRIINYSAKLPKLNLSSFDFNDFPLSEDETTIAVIKIFQEMNVMTNFKIKFSTLVRWVCSVKHNYRPVLYHNWRHAVNVAQMMYAMLKTGKMKKYFTNFEMFLLLVACISHDLDHRGTNNSFESKMESPLMKLYSTSILERHHFDMCLTIIQSEGNNIFENLSEQEYRFAAKMLEKAILSTDLAIYFQKRNKFLKITEESRKIETEEDFDLLKGMMMTACDVSAITKPWQIQKFVAVKVASEFFEQGDKEKNILKSQPIDMMNRDKKNELPKMQVGFIDGVCMSVYKAFSKLQKELTPMLTGIQNNRKNWQRLADKYKKTEKSVINFDKILNSLPPANIYEESEDEDRAKVSIVNIGQPAKPKKVVQKTTLSKPKSVNKKKK